MAPTFVATSATPGWVLGLWSQTSVKIWEERKQGTKEAYTFEAVDAPTAPGSRTVRLRMAGGGTEALVLDNSVQIFVDGQYSGEFLGHWEDPALEAGAPQAPQAKPAPGQRSSGPVESPALMKSAQPPSTGPAAYTAAGPPGTRPPSAYPTAGHGHAPAPASPQGAAMPSRQSRPPTARKQKAANLNTSPAAVQSLVEAARRGKSKDVEKLLGDSIDPDGKGYDGVTPLMAAAQFGSVPAVEALLAAGADPNLGKDGTIPMTIAFQQGHKEILNVLFKSTFQNLDSMVAPHPPSSPGGRSEINGYAESAGDEVPASAIMDLREVTAKLSDLGKPRPNTAVVAQSPAGHDAPPDEDGEEQGKVREDAVKDAMKLIARQK